MPSRALICQGICFGSLLLVPVGFGLSSLPSSSCVLLSIFLKHVLGIPINHHGG